MQQLRKQAGSQNVFEQQKELLGGKADIIFDVGANYGNIIKEYKKYFPGATIYAFEPFPEVFRHLKELSDNLENVHAFDRAVTDKSGSRIFYVNEHADTNSLYKSQEIGISSDEMAKNKSSMEVPATSIDDFCAQNNIDRIDILKMDIQGGELDALKGAASLLHKKKIALVYAEAFFVPQYQDQPLFQDIMVYLDKMGYQLQDIYNPFYGKGSLVWCDAIFLPRK